MPPVLMVRSMKKSVGCFLVFAFSLSLGSAVAHASDTKKKCKGQNEAVKLIDCIKKTDPYKPQQFSFPKGTGGDGGNIHPGQASSYSQ